MKYETVSLKFLNNKKEWFCFSLLIFFVFILNLSNHYVKYIEFSEEELFQTSGQVINKYQKQNYDVLKIQSDNSMFFTSINKKNDIEKLDFIDLTLIAQDIDFFNFMKGFYVKSFNIYLIEDKTDLKNKLFQKVNSQHKNSQIAELFNAIFFAIPLSTEIRDFCAIFGISHLIAISGFHLSIMVFIVYWLLYYPYSFIHSRYFPYRNKKYDILLMCSL
ncbi:MAG: ComEC/Rec2 family competence protein, partial [Campylobacteraceae bacterium]|nr:ComEC/Rec2 family competence protein [Campylobacteraceae bacterium]